jgi:NDP-sugar pyrophosphorylase family protein
MFCSRDEKKKNEKKKKKLTFFPGEEKNQKNIFSSSSKTGARVRDSVLLQRVKLHPHSCVSDSIVGWGSSVGQWARVCNKAVIGEDCHVKDEVVLNGTVVLPHKELKESQMEPGTIVM